eukprot:Tamp_35663.p4 GENE.Tamp_35663~~Tamp_35663.p4  ORF type:complete len:100 (+),score=7.61 Tamp_35663:237-536(+)
MLTPAVLPLTLQQSMPLHYTHTRLRVRVSRLCLQLALQLLEQGYHIQAYQTQPTVYARKCWGKGVGGHECAAVRSDVCASLSLSLSVSLSLFRARPRGR